MKRALALAALLGLVVTSAGLAADDTSKNAAKPGFAKAARKHAHDKEAAGDKQVEKTKDKWSKIMAEADTNHDGKLEPEEINRAKKARKEKRVEEAGGKKALNRS